LAPTPKFQVETTIGFVIFFCSAKTSLTDASDASVTDARMNFLREVFTVLF